MYCSAVSSTGDPGATPLHLPADVRINLVIVSVLLLIFTGDFRSVTPAYSGSGLHLGDVVSLHPPRRLAAGIIAGGDLWLVLNRTRSGAAILAVGADRTRQSVGVDLRHMYALTFAVGAAFAGVAGGIISTFQSITPTAGDPYTLQAFRRRPSWRLGGSVPRSLVGWLSD